MDPYKEIGQRPPPSNDPDAYRDAGVFRKRRPGQVPHTIVDDRRLDQAALGMLVFRIAHERGNYALNVNFFKKHFGTGKDLFYNTMKTLIDIGYLERWQSNPRYTDGTDGRFPFASESLDLDVAPQATRKGYRFWAKVHFEELEGVPLALVGVHVYCCSHADTFDITPALIAKRFGISKATARNTLKSMERRGLIRQKERVRSSDGRFMRHAYASVKPAAIQIPDTVKPETGQPDAEKQDTYLLNISTVNKSIHTNSYSDDYTFRRNAENISPNAYNYYDFLYVHYWPFDSWPTPEDLEECGRRLGPDEKILHDLNEATGERFYRLIQTPETCMIFRGLAHFIARHEEIDLECAYEFVLGFVVRRVGSHHSTWLNSPKLITDGLKFEMTDLELRRWHDDLIEQDSRNILAECRKNYGDAGIFRLVGESNAFRYRIEEIVIENQSGTLEIRNWNDLSRLLRGH